MPIIEYQFDGTDTWEPQNEGFSEFPQPSPGNPRDNMLYGVDIPVKSGAGQNCGLLNPSALDPFNDSSTTTYTLVNGATYRNLIIYGDLRAPGVHTLDIFIDNCRMRGGPHIPSSNDAVCKFDNTRSGSGMVYIVDSEIDPQLPSLNRDGIRGNRYDIRRTYIHDVIDGITMYATPSQNGGRAISRAYGCYVDRLRYGYPDYDNGISGSTEHTDGTHNDVVVLTGGKDQIVKGCFLDGTSVDLPGAGTNPSHPQIQASGYAYGAVVIFTNTVGNPLDETVIFEQNWLRGSLSHLNIKPNLVATVRGNRHYRAVAQISTSAGYWVRYDQRSGNGVVVDTDVWVDGPYAGQLLSEPRDRGIHYNA